MTANIYRAPGATFGAYDAKRDRSPRAPSAQRLRPAEPHRAYALVLAQVERRIPRLQALLMSARTDRPGRRRWREHCLGEHGRDAYRSELVQARQLRALCRRAVSERWVRAPEGADSALAAYERAATHEQQWPVLDRLKDLLRREIGPMKRVPRNSQAFNRSRARLPRR